MISILLEHAYSLLFHNKVEQSPRNDRAHRFQDRRFSLTNLDSLNRQEVLRYLGETFQAWKEFYGCIDMLSGATQFHESIKRRLVMDKICMNNTDTSVQFRCTHCEACKRQIIDESIVLREMRSL